MSVGYTSAIGSHVGMVRSNNQDSGYAGNRLFLVADGMGGHAGGDVASALTARAVAKLDVQPSRPGVGGGPNDTAEFGDDAATRPGAQASDGQIANVQEIAATRQGTETRQGAETQQGPETQQGTPTTHGTQTAHDTQLADPYANPREAAEKLADALLQANRLLRATVGERPELAGLGTTFSGFITVGDKLALAHIGDSRLYLLRHGKMTQITKDHTFVQRLVDSGRITEEEAKTHPRRSVLMRVLGDVDSSPEIDTEVLDTRPGDLWLLCSDGLCGYVEEDDIEKILLRRSSLQGAIDALIDKALSHGAPDNVTAVLVETEQGPASNFEQGSPRFAGSAATEAGVEATAEEPTSRVKALPRRRVVRRAQAVEESHFEPRVDEYLNELIAETKRRNRRRRLLWAVGLVAVVAVLVGGAALGYQWTQSRYFVGTDGETVIIYRGVQQNLASFSLSSVAENTEIPMSALDGLERRQVERTLSASSLEEARDIVARLGVGDS